MKKNKLVLIIFFTFIFVCTAFVAFSVFNAKKNRQQLILLNEDNNKNISNTNILIKKYKDLGYTVLVDDIVFCNKDLDCAYDTISNCAKSTFLALSKAENVGYIVDVNGIDESNNNFCSFKIVNGNDHSKVLNCSVNYKELNKEVFNNIFEFKKQLEYCE